MNEDTNNADEFTESLPESMFPTLDMIADNFVDENGIDFEGLTTQQLLLAVREAFAMHHAALQEVAASIRTLGMFAGALDDRIENEVIPVPEAKPENPTPSPIIIPSIKKEG